MDTTGELVERCARHRAETIGGLSNEGYAELVEAVRSNPKKFAVRPDDQAFMLLCEALDARKADSQHDEMLDDSQYAEARSRRLALLQEAAAQALAIDPSCTDARLVAILARDTAPSPLLDQLLDLQRELFEQGEPVIPPSGDAWNDAFERPKLRVAAAAARLCLSTTHARMAVELSRKVLDAAPSDALGCRFTLALAYARLEDEDALDALDVQFERRGNAWMHLARALLFFKLDRLSAAKRALHGYSELCEGGAYALARPTYVERYIPDRPAFKPGSFEEAVLANHEADPIVMDTPDFVGWAMTEGGLSDAAGAWAERYGLEW